MEYTTIPIKRNLALQFTVEQNPIIITKTKRQKPSETNVERFERLTGVNPCLCPVCKTGRIKYSLLSDH